MSRRISKYPNSPLPKAESMNHELHAGNAVGFRIHGYDFHGQMSVMFWNYQLPGGGLIATVTNPVEWLETEAGLPTMYSIEGEVDLANSGIYQLVLINPQSQQRAQPFWILLTRNVAPQPPRPPVTAGVRGSAKMKAKKR